MPCWGYYALLWQKCCIYILYQEMQEKKQTVTFLSCLAETNYGYKKIYHHGRREDDPVE